MVEIGISILDFEDRLNSIGQGFKSSSADLYKPKFKSTYPSVEKPFKAIGTIASVLTAYHEFLASDTVDAKAYGRRLVEADQKVTDALGTLPDKPTR
jgi:hypothetical protein